MKQLLLTICLMAFSSAVSAQTTYDYASIEFSPGIRKLGVFGTSLPAKVIDPKAVNMTKRDHDILVSSVRCRNWRQGWRCPARMWWRWIAGCTCMYGPSGKPSGHERTVRSGAGTAQVPHR
ncbi:MAG: hypothetical protein IPJ85_06845 [Flavobacteriales bacterium]|nr:hypothetical protein [Flavobacteriales bacterium]